MSTTKDTRHARGVRKPKKKKKSNLLSLLLLLILTGAVSFGAYKGYEFYDDYTRAQAAEKKSREGLDKAGDALKDKPEKPVVPATVSYEKGYVYGKIRIPSVGLEVAITEGLGPEKKDTAKDHQLLDYTVAHVATTKHPGQNSQIYLAGHREMHFSSLANLQDKAEIFIDMPYGTFKYIVHAAPAKEYPEQKVGMVVKETRGDAILPALPYEELVLQTCFPFQRGASANHRFLVYAYPEGVTPKVSLPDYQQA